MAGAFSVVCARKKKRKEGKREREGGGYRVDREGIGVEPGEGCTSCGQWTRFLPLPCTI